jgi:hypothetical protein
MTQAISIHVGVNRPGGRNEPDLVHSEASALRMAQLAREARFESPLVLCGAWATREAVVRVLGQAAELLGQDDRLLVTFSGHGCHQTDMDEGALRDRSGQDQGWCLHDGTLLDDQLLTCWQRFKPGVDVVIVSESCYSGDVARDEPLDFCRAVGATLPAPGSAARGEGIVYRDGSIGYPDGTVVLPDGTIEHPDGTVERPGAAVTHRDDAYRGDPYRSTGGYDAPCATTPRGNDGIQARVLLLAACQADQTARDGLFSCHLLSVWDAGRFGGSYCELFHRVKERVMADTNPQQVPNIMVLGSADAGMAMDPAFHVPVYR